MIKGFTSWYNCILLVFYEILDTMNTAIVREKQIKAGSRAKKLQLIEIMNPRWRDLEDIV
jgi:predicted GIY-YIG superfamily endonuclease